jgi:hypothetical protein
MEEEEISTFKVAAAAAHVVEMDAGYQGCQTSKVFA